jgi:hypothetical protein
VSAFSTNCRSQAAALTIVLIPLTFHMTLVKSIYSIADLPLSHQRYTNISTSMVSTSLGFRDLFNVINATHSLEVLGVSPSDLTFGRKSLSYTQCLITKEMYEVYFALMHSLVDRYCQFYSPWPRFSKGNSPRVNIKNPSSSASSNQISARRFMTTSGSIHINSAYTAELDVSKYFPREVYRVFKSPKTDLESFLRLLDRHYLALRRTKKEYKTLETAYRNPAHPTVPTISYRDCSTCSRQ